MKTALAWFGGFALSLHLLAAVGVFHLNTSLTAYPVTCVKGK
jgi:hypothetical protein